MTDKTLKLKDLLELHAHGHSAEEGDAWGYEMARRLRKLDEEIRAVEAMEAGHGIRHPFIFTERLRLLLDGGE